MSTANIGNRNEQIFRQKVIVSHRLAVEDEAQMPCRDALHSLDELLEA